MPDNQSTLSAIINPYVFFIPTKIHFQQKHEEAKTNMIHQKAKMFLVLEFA